MGDVRAHTAHGIRDCLTSGPTEHGGVVPLLEYNHRDLCHLQLQLPVRLAAVEAAVLPGGGGEDEGDGQGGGRLVGDHGDPRPGPGVGDEAGVVTPGDLNNSVRRSQPPGLSSPCWGPGRRC